MGIEAVAATGRTFRLGKAVAEYTLKYAVGEIPRPPHWSGSEFVLSASSSGMIDRSVCTTVWNSVVRRRMLPGLRFGCSRNADWRRAYFSRESKIGRPMTAEMAIRL